MATTGNVVTAAGVGAAGGFLGNLAMTGISAGINAAAASKAHDRQKNMMTRGPTYMMQGLRDAGINPILAAGSGGLGGSASKIAQAHAARGTDSATQGALTASTMRLQNAATAKAVAERDIIAARQPYENWKAHFYGTPEGEQLIQTSLENEALPKTIPAAGARILYRMRKNPMSPNSGRWPVRIQGSPPHSVEDNKR